MPSWVSSLLWCLGSGFLAYTLLQAPWVWARRLGGWMVFATMGLALWFWTEDWVFAVGGVALWFIIPSIQALVFSRGLRFSPDRRLVGGAIDLEAFPEINGITRDVRGEGFVSAGDYWMQPSPFEQGYRLFRHGEGRADVALAVVRQGSISLSYLILLTCDREGRYWITWNYPLAYGLRLPPQAMVHRDPEAGSFSELWLQHEEFLRINGVETQTMDGATPVERFDALFGATLKHNQNLGMLTHRSGGELAYSWKGSIFLGWQVFCDAVLR